MATGITGWDLYSTLQEQAQYAEYYKSAQPVACPVDGTPLTPGPPSQPGILFCKFDGWQWPRDYDAEAMSGM